MIFGKPDPKAVKPSNERTRMPPATPLSMPATPPNSSALRHEPPGPAPTTSSAPSSSASTVAAPSSRPEASTAAIRQIDRPEIAETFADCNQRRRFRWADAADRICGDATR
jgi:hypothetical protein